MQGGVISSSSTPDRMKTRCCTKAIEDAGHLCMQHAKGGVSAQWAMWERWGGGGEEAGRSSGRASGQAHCAPPAARQAAQAARPTPLSARLLLFPADFSRATPARRRLCARARASPRCGCPGRARRRPPAASRARGLRRTRLLARVVSGSSPASAPREGCSALGACSGGSLAKSWLLGFLPRKVISGLIWKDFAGFGRPASSTVDPSGVDPSIASAARRGRPGVPLPSHRLIVGRHPKLGASSCLGPSRRTGRDGSTGPSDRHTFTVHTNHTTRATTDEPDKSKGVRCKIAGNAGVSLLAGAERRGALRCGRTRASLAESLVAHMLRPPGSKQRCCVLVSAPLPRMTRVSARGPAPDALCLPQTSGRVAAQLHHSPRAALKQARHVCSSFRRDCPRRRPRPRRAQRARA